MHGDRKNEPTENCNYVLLSAERSSLMKVSTQTPTLCQPLWKKWKMALALQKYVIKQHFQLSPPVFQVSTETKN